MKRITIILVTALALMLLASCSEQAPTQTNAPSTTQTTIAETTEAPTEASTEGMENVPVNDIDPIGLVGVWQRTHAEVEGDKNENTQATITISGSDSNSLIFTFEDTESSNFNITEKPLEVRAGQLFADCGNDIWYAEAASGSNTYSMTMLDDNILLLQLTFDFDGQPMISTQWFALSE